MDPFDLLWNSGQDAELRELREQAERRQLEQDLRERDVRALAAENAELRLRLALLVRLLIARGVVTAEEYAGLLAEARRPPA